MSLIGELLLILAAVTSFGAVALSLGGRLLRRPRWSRWGVWALSGTLVAATGAMLLLLTAFLTRDFSNLYVFEHSSRSLSFVYTVSAVWAGNAGSLLLWLLVLAAMAVASARGAWRRSPLSAPYLVATLSAMTLFFSLLLLFGPNCNPFVQHPTSPPPSDGLGLNPMLLHPGMVVHPVALYLGYVAMAMPFALMVAGLVNGDAVASWIAPLRRWALAGWLFLTIGNVVGAWWAYVTLGWGGYWAWDPVENASLVPWLTATALLHSVIIVERKDRHRLWMVSLTSVTFLLTVFGTFLTRSGVVASVHAFTASGMIPWFASFLLAMLVLAVAVVGRRISSLRRDDGPVPLISETFSFFCTELLLSVITFVILWGMVFPPLVHAFGGGEFGLGPEFFNAGAAPLGLLLVLLTALCPLVRDSRGSKGRLSRDLLVTGGFGLLVLIILLVLGVRRPYPLAAFALASMLIATVVLTFVRNRSVRRVRRRYGALLVHLGLAILVIGIAGSWSYKQSVDGDLAQDEALFLGNVQVTYRELSFSDELDKSDVRARLALTVDGRPGGELLPSLEYYPASDQIWTRVARRGSLGGDVYVTLLAVSLEDDVVSLRLELHPLIGWLWVGGGIMALGGAIALWPARRRRHGAVEEATSSGDTPDGRPVAPSGDPSAVAPGGPSGGPSDVEG
ncbi:MAG: heme lyase CcmF/NrfE family subunit [Actinobacteria bacterium]|nr:heme lyase CcmF/NrfE family subunit [Actinomycetota bacterium]